MYVMTFDESVLELRMTAQFLSDCEKPINIDDLHESDVWLLTHETLRHVLRLRDCVGCRVNVAGIGEWYSVTNVIWNKYGVADRVALHRLLGKTPRSTSLQVRLHQRTCEHDVARQ